MLRQGLVLLLAGLLAGCAVGPGECPYESRVLNFRADLSGIVHGKADSGVASLQLAETSGSLSYRMLNAEVQTWLAGAIADVRVINTVGRGRDSVVLVIPGQGNTGEWSGFLRLESHRPTASELRLLESLNGLDMLVTIGTAPGGTLRGKLQLLEDTEWERPYCD